MSMFDFGEGPVPAHRHANPDGSIGGWVANISTVGPSCWVSPDSQVWGWSTIIKASHVVDGSRVSDSFVCDESKIQASTVIGSDVICKSVVCDSTVNNSTIDGRSMVLAESIVDMSTVADRSVVNDHATVEKGSIVERGLVCGFAQMSNSILSNGWLVGDSMTDATKDGFNV